MELVSVDFNLAEDAKKIDKRLTGLKWISPDYANMPLNEINLLIDTKNILSQAKGRKIIITDYNFFSSILGNRFASPNKWYDNLSIPEKKNKFYYEYKNFFLSKIKNNKIQYVYIIGAKDEKMFFTEFIDNSDCIVSNKLNELLVEFQLNKCRF